MINKKAFAITPTELILMALTIIFAIGWWFVIMAVRTIIMDTWNMSILGSLWVGVGIILAILFIVKFRVYKFVLK